MSRKIDSVRKKSAILNGAGSNGYAGDVQMSIQHEDLKLLLALSDRSGGSGGVGDGRNALTKFFERMEMPCY